MPSLFGVNFPAVIASAMGSGLLPVTLTVVTSAARTPGALTSGTNATTVAHSCRGVVIDYTDLQVDGTKIQKGDRKVMLLAGTLASGVIPKCDDRVTIQSATYTVVRVTSDPANATWSLQVRGA